MSRIDDDAYQLITWKYSRVSIIRNCGDYFNKPESPEVRMKFALRVIWACKNRPHSHDMSTESNTNVILVQKINSMNREFE